MFNDTEIQLAQTVLNEIKNAAGSGFNYMVQGTIVSNELSLMGLGVTILASLVIAGIAYITEQGHDKSGSAFVYGFLTMLIVGILCLIATSCILGIICPEYTLINSLITRSNC